MRLALANQKGGVGKSTLAVSLAGALAELGEQVLLVDWDPQGAASASLGVSVDGWALVRAVRRGASLDRFIVPGPVRGLDVIPSAPELSGLDDNSAAKDALRVGLATVRRPWVLIDTTPHLGPLTTQALIAADAVLVPFEAHPLSILGLVTINREVAAIRERYHAGLEVLGYIPNRCRPRTIVHREALESMERAYPGRVAPEVRENIELALAPAQGKPITDAAPRAIGAEDVRTVVRWIIDRKERRKGAP